MSGYVKAIYLIAFLSIFNNLYSQVYSVQDGNWSDKNTWGGIKPGKNDIIYVAHDVSLDAAPSKTVVVLNGGKMFVDKKNQTINLVDINSGGEIILNQDMKFVQLINNGLISGNSEAIFKDNAATLDGIGEFNFTTPGFINVQRPLTILNSSQQIINQYINVADAITNNGFIDLNGDLIDAGGTWTNGANSILQIEGILFDILNPGQLFATGAGNTVEYDGSLDQNIYDAAASTYTNLTINNAGIKTLQNNIVITNNISIKGGTLNHFNGTFFSNINLFGDWLNTGGFHDGSGGIVNVESTSIQTISHTWGARTETFFQLFINGASVKTLNAHLLLNDYMEINSTIDVSLADFQIELKRDFVINGSLLPREGLVKMSGTVPQIISTPTLATFYNLEIDNTTNVTLSTGNYNLRGTLSLTNGMFNTNNAMTLVSDGTFQGNVGEITGGDINGDVTLERYIPAGKTDWRMLCSGISGSTLADWSGDFITAGYPGSQYPTFPFISIYSYNESVAGDKDMGWVAPLSNGESISSGKGYFCYVGDGQVTTNALKLNVTGPINKNNITIPLSYNAVGPVGILDDGWNLIGNPYPSSVNWDSPDLIKNNIYDVYYIWDPSIQNFAYHAGGLFPVSGNGGSNIIGSSQAIWVQTFASPASLEFVEKVKNNDDSWKSVNYSEIPLLNIKISSNTFWDETKIRFIDNATASFDYEYDIKKLFSTNTAVPRISTVSSNLNLAVNSYSFDYGNVTIPVMTTVESSGNYTLEFDNVFDFPLGSCIYLDDLHTGLSYNIRDTSILNIFLSDTNVISHRFELTVSKPIEKVIEDVTCHNLNDGNIKVKGNGNGNWDYTLLDISGNLISQTANSASDFIVTNLPANEYILNIMNHGNYCAGLITDTITITQPDDIIISNSISNPKCFGEENGTIDIIASGGTPPYQVLWSNGVTSVNNENLGSGEYSIDIIDQNNCKDSATYTIEEGMLVMSEFEIFNADKIVVDENVQIINKSINANDNYWQFGNEFNTSFETTPIYNFSDTGVVLIKLNVKNGSCIDSSEISIFVNPKYFDALDDKEFFYFQNNNLLNISLLNFEESCVIYNVNGQMIPIDVVSKSNSMLTLNRKNFPSGIYIAVITNKASNSVRTGKIYIE